MGAAGDEGRVELAFAGDPGEKKSMSVTGKVKNGMIELPPDVHWPSGTVVRVEPVEEEAPALLELLKDFDGMAEDLPPDLASHLDHYVHGQRRQ